MRSEFGSIGAFLIFIMWLHGVCLANGFWLTIAAIVLWPYALILSGEKIFTLLGLM